MDLAGSGSVSSGVLHNNSFVYGFFLWSYIGSSPSCSVGY